MKTSHCIFSGSRFAEGEFLANTYKPHLFDHFMLNCPACFPPLIEEQFAELMNALRLHTVILDHDVFRSLKPAQKRSPLVRNSCLNKVGELESLVKEVRLLVDPVAFSQLGD